LSKDVLLQTESDPICSSAGCTKVWKHKGLDYDIDYFVPNFGEDRDITDSKNSLAAEEKR